MQTKQCPHCQQNIVDKAYDIHLKICSKRLVARPAESGTPSVTEPLVAVEPTSSPLAGELPKPGTAEYMAYWRGLSAEEQKEELARRKSLGSKPNAVVTPLVSTTDTTPDTKSQVTTHATSAGGDRGGVVTAAPGAVPAEVAPGNGAMEVFYPKPDPHFLVSENIIEALRVTEAISHRHPTNLLVTGQPGGGKTCLALQFAAKFNRPAVVADFGVLQEPQQLFQTTRLVQGEGETMVTDIRETGFVKGMETKGCVVIMDEINRPENERVLNVLMPLLDGRKNCWIEDLRRRINVADDVIFVATLNEGALFCGVTSIDLALRDRFREIFLDYLPAEPESQVLQAKAGIPKLIANSLAEFAYVVRTTPAIGKKMSTRQLLHAAEAYAEGTTLWQAVEAALGNYNDLEWRQQVMEIFSLNIKDETEYKRWTDRKVDGKYVKY